MSNNLKGQMSSKNGQHDANSGHQANTIASGAYNELPEVLDEANTAEDTKPSGEEISTTPPAAPNTIHKTSGPYNNLEGSDEAKTAKDTKPSGEKTNATHPAAPNTIPKPSGVYNEVEGSDQANTAKDTKPSGA